MRPLASVLIPTHSHPATLPLTVDTVLRQRMPDLEVLIIGDGVTSEVRDVVEHLVTLDERVRFLDFPKGPHHGERYRHDAILAARGDAVMYLCDDDLLLPDHVGDLLELLETHDLVQSRNGYVHEEGYIRAFADDLSDPESRRLHLQDEPRFNSLSITGTAHSRLIYEKVDDPWDTTPAGWWPDHHQFRKLLREPSCRAATSRRMTALQFPTSIGRRAWTDEERLAEIRPWYDVVVSPGAQEEIDRRYAAGAELKLVMDRRELVAREHEAALERRLRLQREQELAEVREQLTVQRRRTRRLRRQLAEERRRAELRWGRRLRRRLGALRRTVLPGGR
ncbi:MAG: glycosyltransferase [Marmoricola sp.]|nr:glycosyltransferase [Marmoricola sp.]